MFKDGNINKEDLVWWICQIINEVDLNNIRTPYIIFFWHMKRPLFLPFPIELRIWGIVGYFCALCKCHLFMMLTTNHKAVLYVEKITKRFLQVILLFQTFLVHREKLKTSVSETNNYKCQITSRLLALISIHFAIYLWSGIKFLSCSPVDYNIMSKLKIPVNMSCTGKKDYHSYASICHPLWFFFIKWIILNTPLL